MGMLYGNTLHTHKGFSNLQEGIGFFKQKLLRCGVILYGFRITLQSILQSGPEVLIIAVFMMTTTSLLGWFVGTKILKLDEKVTLLLTSGCSVCGVTAVLSTEQVVEAERHQTTMSVATVVIFGTLSMTLYPILYQYLPFDAWQMGLYTGSTIHELAGVISAGNEMGIDVTSVAVITKLTRVMLLGPYLFAMSIFVALRGAREKKNKI